MDLKLKFAGLESLLYEDLCKITDSTAITLEKVKERAGLNATRHPRDNTSPPIDILQNQSTAKPISNNKAASPSIAVISDISQCISSMELGGSEMIGQVRESETADLDNQQSILPNIYDQVKDFV